MARRRSTKRAEKEDGNSRQAEASPTTSHNANARADIIRDVAGNIIRLKADRSAINEQITEEKARIKALDMRMQDFNVALRLYELEEVETRDKAMDSLRECFSALELGGTVDWIDVVSKVSADGKGSFNEDSAAATGEADGKQGKRTNAGLYERNPALKAKYDAGYMKGTAVNLPGKSGGDPFGPAETTTH